MPVRLTPSVLAATAPSYRRRFRLATRLSRRVHVDIMDGAFVPTKSVGPNILSHRFQSHTVMFHLMVSRPLDWVPVIRSARPSTVVVHIESRDVITAIRSIRRTGCSVVVAINPSTPLSRLRPVLKLVDGIQLMTVHPGHYHAPLIAKADRRIRETILRYPGVPLSVDGGVNRRTIGRLIAAGAKEFTIGSSVMLSATPAKRWRELLRFTRTVKS
ncbi:MAG: hypothetical protein HY975_01095 [Candidatus Kerfeldbacteria bacterium]|nr:hypothetical protein [Candidatus Kerfeldbacteria bacterium]